ncbi:hypothetical protein [Kiritimatiella glycovorans]|uniref:PEP-CTERM system TPR-repeat lipoprotein n=1 Tax=Kiritimatiella glycovorans TaxID=1307763 RepID=A0A0G3EAI8_9BACT|nr:hypothetical protein [Kiritimatiella glycovorans]AKJ63461.1 hypothetical protein L21SP4_00177 [Kiritimatiella glycovorans]
MVSMMPRSFRRLAAWIPVLALLLPGAAGSACAQTQDHRVTAFKEQFEGGAFERAVELGRPLREAFPDDAILRYQYAAACFVTGDFEAVIAAAEDDAMIPLLPAAYEKEEEMGFEVYSWALWQCEIQALAASKRVDEALRDIKRSAGYENRPLLFLQYCLLQYRGQIREAEAVRARWFSQPYHGKPEGELYARRVIPAMEVPDNLESWVTSAATHDEITLLRACAGFQDWLDGRTQRGMRRMTRAVREANPATAGIPQTLLALCLPEGESIGPHLKPGLDDPRWRKQSKAYNAYIEAYIDSDWPRLLRRLDEVMRLSPRNSRHRSYAPGALGGGEARSGSCARTDSLGYE